MRSPEKCGYSVGKLWPTAKLCMIAVFGPKSLYSGLEICSLVPLVLNDANIIQDTRTTYPRMTNQSAKPEPLGRGTYVLPAKVLRLSTSACFMILCFHFFHDNVAIAAAANKRFPHKSGCRARVKSSPARYVNHVLISSPESIAAAHRCATDAYWYKAAQKQDTK